MQFVFFGTFRTVDSLKEANLKLEQSLSSSESSQTDKIDKSLIKSLLIGYVVSGHAGDKQQVLRMISTLLDFNDQEANKVGLNKPQSSWLGSILGGGGGGSSSTSSGKVISIELPLAYPTNLHIPSLQAMRICCRLLYSFWNRNHSRNRRRSRDPIC